MKTLCEYYELIPTIRTPKIILLITIALIVSNSMTKRSEKVSPQSVTTHTQFYDHGNVVSYLHFGPLELHVFCQLEFGSRVHIL